MCRMDATPLHVMFKHWRKVAQRARRQCEKALQMHQRRTWAYCFYALQKNADHSQHNRRLHIAAAKCVQRWTVRKCQAVMHAWHMEAVASKHRAAQAASMDQRLRKSTLRGVLRQWCAPTCSTDAQDAFTVATRIMQRAASASELLKCVLKLCKLCRAGEVAYRRQVRVGADKLASHMRSRLLHQCFAPWRSFAVAHAELEARLRAITRKLQRSQLFRVLAAWIDRVAVRRQRAAVVTMATARRSRRLQHAVLRTWVEQVHEAETHCHALLEGAVRHRQLRLLRAAWQAWHTALSATRAKLASAKQMSALAARVRIMKVFLGWRELAEAHTDRSARADLLRFRIQRRLLASCLTGWQERLRARDRIMVSIAAAAAAWAQRKLAATLRSWRRLVLATAEAHKAADELANRRVCSQTHETLHVWRDQACRARQVAVAAQQCVSTVYSSVQATVWSLVASCSERIANLRR